MINQQESTIELVNRMLQTIPSRVAAAGTFGGGERDAIYIMDIVAVITNTQI
jgi:hypothetical protein